MLGQWAGIRTDVVFTPHLIPMDRGELITAYAEPSDAAGTDDLLALLREPRTIERVPVGSVSWRGFFVQELEADPV